MSELDDFYPPPPPHHHNEHREDPKIMEKHSQLLDQDDHVEVEYKNNNVVVDEISSENMAIEPTVTPAPEEAKNEEVVKKPVELMRSKKKKKKKKRDKFEIFKGLCEAVVNKMMAQQEEMHNKLIEDIVKRDEEKIAREEAWKNQEMDRIRIEFERRTKERESAGERQSAIIEFLKKFTNDEGDKEEDQLPPSLHELTTTSLSSDHQIDHHQDNKVETSTTTSSSMNNNNQNPNHTSSPTPVTERSSGDHCTGGKRWPRDEVLALINLRCKLMMNSNNAGNNGGGGGDEMIDGGGGGRGPLWERISQGMMELGYNRNAKRCKEKWENINKYFRKTKDSNKKRSVNSRTCPYFQQLSCLYSEGEGGGISTGTVVVGPSDSTVKE